MKAVLFTLLVVTGCLELASNSLAALPDAAAAPDSASAAPPPSAAPERSAAELEKLAQPIALHPDPLIAIILPASVYPVEVVQAARFVKDPNNIPKIEEQNWDENVKAVAKFPELIAKMDTDLAWTTELGQAFLAQPKELMDTIQALRGKAQKAGTLQNTSQQVVVVTNVVSEKVIEQQVVVVTNTVVQIQPSNPQTVYVPTYPPTVYYPPPAYVYDPLAPLLTFGAGMAMGAIIANNCDWHGGGVYWGGGYHGDVDIDVNNVNIDRSTRNNINSGNRTANRGAGGTQQKWQPNQTRLASSGATPKTQAARGWSGGGAQAAQRPAAGTASARPAQSPSGGVGGGRPGQQPGVSPSQRPSASTQPARSPSASPTARPSPSASPAVGRSSGGGSTAFAGANSSGNAARSSANRGNASRSGGAGVGGGGGRAGGGGRGGGRGR